MFHIDNNPQYPVRTDPPNPLFARAPHQACGPADKPCAMTGPLPIPNGFALPDRSAPVRGWPHEGQSIDSKNSFATGKLHPSDPKASFGMACPARGAQAAQIAR